MLKKPKIKMVKKRPKMIKLQRRNQLLEESCIKAKTSRKIKRKRKTRRRKKSFCFD